MWHVWRTGDIHRRFRRGNLRERDRLEALELDGRRILQCVIKKWDGVWTELIWLRLGKGGVLF